MTDQLDLFQATDQSFYLSDTWGLCDFFPTKDDKWAHNCRICILNRSDECDKAPCTAEERTDGQRGYFSIHHMPQARKPQPV